MGGGKGERGRERMKGKRGVQLREEGGGGI